MTLKQLASRSDRQAAVKAAAAQKLAVLKARLKTLEMFGVDPKSKAQEAARIAREIGDAAKEYSQAGGSANAAAATTWGAPSPAASSPAASGRTETDAVISSSQIDPSAAKVISAAIPSTGPSTAGNATAGIAQRTSSSGQAGQSSSRAADLTFISEARLLARRASAILQSAIEEATRKKEKTSGTVAESDKALVSIDVAAFSLELGRGVPVETSAGYSASAQSVSVAPAASIEVTA